MSVFFTESFIPDGVPEAGWRSEVEGSVPHPVDMFQSFPCLRQAEQHPEGFYAMRY